MISKIINHSAINSKILAMKRSALSEKEYDELLKLSSVPEVAVYLKENTRYKSVFSDINAGLIHRGELEAILKRRLRADIKSILSFSQASVKFFLYLFTIREEIDIIKLFLRHILTGSTDFYYKKDSLTEKIFLKLKDAGTFSELAEALIDTEYYAALKPFIGEPERQNLFEIETALDMMMNKLCIKYINTLLSKEEAKIVMRSYGIRSDLELIMFILRSKKYYGFTPKQIYPHINIHTYRLKEEDIKAMANANNQEEILNIVKTTPYKRVFSDKADFYEKSISKFILEIHHSLYRKNPYSIEAILFYIALKNVEINNITTLIEGIRYGLAPEEIREHLIIIK